MYRRYKNKGSRKIIMNALYFCVTDDLYQNREAWKKYVLSRLKIIEKRLKKNTEAISM